MPTTTTPDPEDPPALRTRPQALGRPEPPTPGAKIPVQTHMDPRTVKRLAAYAAIGWALVAVVLILVLS